MNKLTASIRGAIAALVVASMLGCSSTPAPPDWKLNAQGAAERAVAAYLEGRQRVDQAETARLRAEIARTGDLALMARVELLRCAAQVASLDPSACTAFDALRQDAQPPELAISIKHQWTHEVLVIAPPVPLSTGLPAYFVHVRPRSVL